MKGSANIRGWVSTSPMHVLVRRRPAVGTQPVQDKGGPQSTRVQQQRAAPSPAPARQANPTTTHTHTGLCLTCTAAGRQCRASTSPPGTSPQPRGLRSEGRGGGALGTVRAKRTPACAALDASARARAAACCRAQQQGQRFCLGQAVDQGAPPPRPGWAGKGCPASSGPGPRPRCPCTRTSRGLALFSLHVHGLDVVRGVGASRGDVHVVLAAPLGPGEGGNRGGLAAGQAAG